MKRNDPPAKSPLMKILATQMGKEVNSDDQSDEAMMLDCIGCTANVMLVDYVRRKLVVANAGDSRCVMGHGGKCVPLSFDHKPENPVEIERIYKAGSTITDGRVDGNLNLTRALGDLKYKQQSHLKPEEHPVTANPDIFEYDMPDDLDFVIMGCDGVWEQKSNEEMVAWFYKKLGSNPYNAKLSDTVTDLLKNECLSPDHMQTSGLGCDNMTCILIVFGR